MHTIGLYKQSIAEGKSSKRHITDAVHYERPLDQLSHSYHPGFPLFYWQNKKAYLMIR